MQTDKEYAIQLAMEYGFTGGFDAQGDLTYDSEFVEAILEAIAKEREACAKVCEEHGKVWGERMLFGFQATLDDAAEAIRARGQQ